MCAHLAQFLFILLDFEVFIQLSILQGAIIPVENLPIFQKNTKTDAVQAKTLSDWSYDIDDASTSSEGASCEMYLFVGAFIQAMQGGRTSIHIS